MRQSCRHTPCISTSTCLVKHYIFKLEHIFEKEGSEEWHVLKIVAKSHEEASAIAESHNFRLGASWKCPKKSRSQRVKSTIFAESRIIKYSFYGHNDGNIDSGSDTDSDYSGEVSS
jgi:predicted secreted protein